MLTNTIILGIVAILKPVFSQLIINLIKQGLKNKEDWVALLPDWIEGILKEIIDGVKPELCNFAENYHRMGTVEEETPRIETALESVKNRIKNI